MVGILGGYACRLVTVSIPGFTTAPSDVLVDSWDEAQVDRGGWASGDGPVSAVVPVDGAYLVTLSTEFEAIDAIAVADVQAQLRASFGGVLLALESPAWVVDDGEGTTYVAGSASGVVPLTAGTLIEVALSVGNADAAMTDAAVHFLTVDLVRVVST